VQGRDSACPGAYLQLSQFNLLRSRWYVLSIFFQCLQDGSFLQYTCDSVRAHLDQTFSVQEVNCIKILPKKRGRVTKSKQNCFYSENMFLMEVFHRLNNQLEIFVIVFSSPRCLCVHKPLVYLEGSPGQFKVQIHLKASLSSLGHEFTMP